MYKSLGILNNIFSSLNHTIGKFIWLPVAFFILLIFMFMFWKRVKADKAIVITGFKKRVLSGKGGFIFQPFETWCEISLENLPMNTDVTDSPSKGGLLVDVSCTAVVKVRNTSEAIMQAVEQFCQGNTTRTTQMMSESVEKVLEGQLRGVVAKLTVDQIVADIQAFSDSIEEGANKDLARMGLELISYTVLKITTPKSGYLENRAKHQEAHAKADADIIVAECKRDTDQKTAVAQREGQQAKLQAETEIADAQRNKEIKTQSYRAQQDKAKAEADLAYELQKNEKQVEVEQAKARLAEQEAIAKEKQLIATQIRPAEAAKEQKLIEAEADKIKAIKEAEARAKAVEIEAEAMAHAERVKAEAAAYAIAQKGKAEAEAIKAKGLSEAEAMQKKAQAYARYGSAAIVDVVMQGLPVIMEQIAKPMEAIDKVTVIDSGNGESVSSLSKTVTNVAGTGFHVFEDLTGVDIKKLLADMADSYSNKNNVMNQINSAIQSSEEKETIENLNKEE